MKLWDVGLIVVVAAVVLFAALTSTSSRKATARPSASSERDKDDVQHYLRRHAIAVPLRADLGSSHWPVLTDSLLAQRYFDQGLRYVVAYNFRLALDSFVQVRIRRFPPFPVRARSHTRQAQQLDARCAMCAWGEVVARGQNLNDFLNASLANCDAAWAALTRAHDAAATFVPRTRTETARAKRERALVAALSLRQQRAMPADIAQRAPLNDAYADAMDRMAQHVIDKEDRHDDDVNDDDDNVIDDDESDVWILFFAADAQFNTSPWNYWTHNGTTLRPRLARAHTLLERVLRRDAHHVGALHMMIHLFEAAADPTPALQAARTLDAHNVAGSEHLLHMPSHGYIRAGHFARAAHVNRIARATVKLAEHAYPEHNLEFVVVCERLQGDALGSRASAAALHTLSESLLASGRDGYEAIFPYERFVVAALQNAVVFGDWATLHAVCAGAPPPPRRVFHVAHWHWACAHRALAVDDAAPDDVARTHAAALDTARTAMQSADNVRRYSAELYPARELLAILAHWLRAALALHARRHAALGVHGTIAVGIDGHNDADDAHLTHLRAAFDIEDGFLYDEPPSQFFSTAVVLGDCLFAANRFVAARAAYERALHWQPAHPWALFGLARACERTGDTACRDAAAQGFGRAWNATGAHAAAPRQHICACQA